MACSDCEWAFVLQRSNVEVIADIDDECATGYLNLDAEAIAAMEGERVIYGYVPEYLGHIKLLVRYNDKKGDWKPMGYVSFSRLTGELTYDIPEGWCGY